MDQKVPESVQRLDVEEEWRAIHNLRKPYQEEAAALKKEREMAKELLTKIQVEMGKRDNVRTLDDLLEVTFRWAEWDQHDAPPANEEQQLAFRILQDLFGNDRVRAVPNANSGMLHTLDFVVLLPL